MHLANDLAQKTLEKMFPLLSTPILFGESEESKLLDEFYDILFVSAFDHWLTEEECDKLSLCFADFLKSNDESYLEKLEKFKQFYSHFFNIGAFSWEENQDYDKLSFIAFDDYEEYIIRCQESALERKFLNICVPDMQMVICGGFDLTHKILMKKEKSKNDLINLANNSHLYLLN